MVLAALSWAVFAVLSTLVMRPFVRLSASSPEAIAYGVTYDRIVCIGSLAAFLVGIWSKVHQAGCNMKLPMLAQVTGAVINVVLDLLLIFGVGGLPAMGVACFILLPVFWLLSLIGLNYTWLAFPAAETAAGALGYIMYRRQLKVWK